MRSNKTIKLVTVVPESETMSEKERQYADFIFKDGEVIKDRLNWANGTIIISNDPDMRFPND